MVKCTVSGTMLISGNFASLQPECHDVCQSARVLHDLQTFRWVVSSPSDRVTTVKQGNYISERLNFHTGIPAVSMFYLLFLMQNCWKSANSPMSLLMAAVLWMTLKFRPRRL